MHDAVARGTPLELVLVQATPTVKKNLEVSPHECGVATSLNLLLGPEEPCQAILFRGIWQRLFEVGCRSARASREREGIDLVELDIAHQREGLLKIILSLAGEADDEVGAERDPGNVASQVGDFLQ